MKTYLVCLLPQFVPIFHVEQSGLVGIAFAGIDKDVMRGFAFLALEMIQVSTMLDSRQSHASLRGKVVRFWIVSAFIIFIALITCHAYERLWGNADGLIRGIAYHNVLLALFWLIIPGLVISIGLTSRQKTLQNLSLSLVSGLFYLLLLEGAGHLIIKLKPMKVSPFSFRRFYIPPDVATIRPFPAGDLNPIAGRAHLPNSSNKFINCECDTLWRTYNSVGANDRQRQVVNPDPRKKRISIVGDSFMEGYMVNMADRCSAILERKTGLEHLNFAVNGSNPVHYYLMYKGVAKAFGADVVLVGFLPANDFEVLNERNAYNLVDWPTYTPYWQGTYPHYTLRYSLANVTQSIFHGTHTQASLLKVVDSVYATLPILDKFKADMLNHSSLYWLLGELGAKKYHQGQFTRYEQFNEEEWHYVSYSLTKLVEEAKGKQVLILSMPTLPDLVALKRGKTNRIDPLLADFCRQKGVGFIPLAPSFLTYTGNLNDLYVGCDGHWSVKGESFVADLLIHNPVYRSLTRSNDREISYSVSQRVVAAN